MKVGHLTMQILNHEGITCTPMITIKFIIKRNEGIAQ